LTALVAWAPTATAAVGSIDSGYQYSSQTHQYDAYAAFYSGTGRIRAWLGCESSNGQTDWTDYGPWETSQGQYSIAGFCTYKRSYGYNT
jgi:hypothetical protein